MLAQHGGEKAVGLSTVRMRGDRRAHIDFRVFQPALLHQRLGAAQSAAERLRLRPRNAPEAVDRFRPLAAIEQQDAKPLQSHAVARPQGQRAAKGSDRFKVASEMLEREAHVVMGLAITGIEPVRALKARGRLLRPRRMEMHETERRVRRRILWPQSHRFRGQPLRFQEAPGVAQLGDPVELGGRWRRNRGGRRRRRRRFAGAAMLELAAAAAGARIVAARRSGVEDAENGHAEFIPHPACRTPEATGFVEKLYT